MKDKHTIQNRTLFGIVTLLSRRVYHCKRENADSKTVSNLTDCLTEHTASELRYFKTK